MSGAKVVTANLLSDGRVVYLGADGGWVDALAKAARHDGAAADDALEAAAARRTEIAGAYLIDVDEAGASGRDALREGVRAAGPTVRPDLGKQAGRP
ncbi:MAG: DUF2849 domain-containing protein [Parvularculaceae bacterium]